MRPLHESPAIDSKSTIDLLKGLIRIPSVNPAIEGGQGEQAIGTFIAQWLRKASSLHVFEQKVTKNRFNVVAVLDGKGNGPSLMFNGHMDTVGVSNMTVSPFRPFVRSGKIHGRGSCDMKGPIAAMMSAMSSLAKSNKKLAGDVMFSAVVDEEYESIGTSALVKRFRSDAAIVGEPTGMQIAVAHKGYAWIEIETQGRRAHGSIPERGIDAIESMARIITQLDSARREHLRKKHALVGTPRIHTSTVAGGSDWSTVPAACTLRLERRLIPGERPQDALAELKRVIAHASRRDRRLRARVKLVHHAASMEIRPDTPHIVALRNCVRRSGWPARIVGVPYWTDASILVNEARTPTCLFGPGDIRVAHSPDEYISAKEVLAAAQIFAQSARQFCAS